MNVWGGLEEEVFQTSVFSLWWILFPHAWPQSRRTNCEIFVWEPVSAISLQGSSSLGIISPHTLPSASTEIPSLSPQKETPKTPLKGKHHLTLTPPKHQPPPHNSRDAKRQNRESPRKPQMHTNPKRSSLAKRGHLWFSINAVYGFWSWKSTQGVRLCFSMNVVYGYGPPDHNPIHKPSWFIGGHACMKCT